MKLQHGDQASRFTVHYSDGWIMAPNQDETSTLLLHRGVAALRASGASDVSSSRLLIQTEKRLDAADAIDRLRHLAGSSDNAEFFTVNGWPAMERYEISEPDRVGADDRRTGKIPLQQRIIFAVAAGDQVVRMEGVIFSDREPDTAQWTGGSYLDMRAIARGLEFPRAGNPDETRQQLDSLRRSLEQARASKAEPALQADEATGQGSGAADEDGASGMMSETAEAGLVINTQNFSEIETVASPDGQTVIVATNGRRYSTSNDGGQTFTQDNIDTGSDIAYPANGDPSLGYGQSGDFYYAFIAFPDGTGGAGNGTAGCTTGVTASTDDGQTFGHRGHATFCALNDPDGNGPLSTCFPDQEHIATDRWNPSASAGDQVYSAWRDFTPGDPTTGAQCNNIGSGLVQSTLTCSSDSGQNWGSRRNLTGDFPRITVGQDGFVYVVTRSFGDDPDDILIDKFSSCDTGLVRQAGFPRTVYASSQTIDCPMPGLDRCNDGNDLRSPTVTVDDLDPTHIFVAVGQHTTTGTNAGANPGDQVGENDSVLIFDSTDGGVNWSAPVTLNNGFTARRYMPWTCAVGGTAYVGWYDRRASNVLDNALTDYYLGSATRTGAGLVAGPEFRVSTDSDSNCAVGWGAAPRSPNDSESCTDQPQLAGVCSVGGARCDFSDGCPAGQGTCQTGGGNPKYGDYSGIACAAGRVYSAFASATPPGGPQGTGGTGSIDSFLRTDIVCCVPQIQVSGSADFGEVCGTELQTTTVEICNTGVENLEIDSIESSNPAFSFSALTSGFPITISKDFCYPLEVTYQPDAGASDAGTLTLATNDPVNPEVEIPVSGSAGEAAISTFIANSGSFGEVCSGDLGDLNLTIQNNGTCPLELDSINLSGADAGDFQLPDGSFAGTVIEEGNSLQVPVRFAPANFTDPSPREASVDVASSTVDGDSLPLDSTPIAGTVPPPDIQAVIANEGNFGEVCKGGQADLDITLFNQGKCDLTISDISLANQSGASFVLPEALDLPLVLSPDADFPYPVRYAPDSCDDTPETADVQITSDDPDEGLVTIGLSGSSPCPNLVIDQASFTGLYAFPATVVDTEGTLGCYSERSTVIRNNGGCPLTISGIAASGDDFTVTAPTLFPIVLPPGEETLGVDIRFTPIDGGDTRAPDERTGLLTITSDDPDAAGTADLCGEGVVRSGIRVLVTDTTTGVPLIVDSVDAMNVRSKGKRTPSPINLSFTDVVPQSTDVCGNQVAWHLNLEQLPSTETTGAKGGKSQYEVSAREGNLQAENTFGLGQCEFNSFQLQLVSSDGNDGGGQCLLAEKGEACSDDGDCCSGKCRGKEGSKVCK